jgi:hypothetical protein
MNKYVCKKSMGTIPNSDIFEVGKSYWGYYNGVDNIGGVYFITNRDVYSETIPMYEFGESEFIEYFMTMDEHRELEIDKVLNI